MKSGSSIIFRADTEKYTECTCEYTQCTSWCSVVGPALLGIILFFWLQYTIFYEKIIQTTAWDCRPGAVGSHPLRYKSPDQLLWGDPSLAALRSSSSGNSSLSPYSMVYLFIAPSSVMRWPSLRAYWVVESWWASCSHA